MSDTQGHAGDGEIIKRANISHCHKYRYRLTRYWGPGYMLPFVMLNPSTADASIDDPTIRRCMGFARREGAGGIAVCNLYAFRATSPADMRSNPNPVGPNNDETLIHLALEAEATKKPIVCAWGAGGGLRAADVIRTLKGRAAVSFVCLGKTKDGHPRHPLYVKGDQPLEPFA